MTVKFNRSKILKGGIMRKVKFLEDYQETPTSHKYKRGDIARFDRQVAQDLMVEGIVTYYFMRELS